jgi:hypothetical protein
MYWNLIITLLVSFLISLVILKILAKTFKFVVFIVIFAIVFGVLYFGYDTLVNKFGNLGSSVTNPGVVTQSSQPCSSDADCAFISSPSDCNLVANSCNNIRDSSKFVKPSTKVKCSIDSVVIDTNVKCSCASSLCQRL